MGNSSWVYVERVRGRVRRVTLLDDELHVIATHDRYDALSEGEPDDCQLLRAAELVRRASPTV
jgi:hypothetical protein